MSGPSELILEVVTALDRLGIPYHLGGSFASSLYGQSRMTADVDLVIEADAARLEALAAALAGRFYVSPTAMAEALEQQRSFNAILLSGPFKVDFFIRGSRPFDLEEFRRAQPCDIGLERARPVRVKSPEDLVVRKLEWFRLGGEASERQWADVIGVLRAMRGMLDEEYLDRWSGELGLSDLLARAREERERG